MATNETETVTPDSTEETSDQAVTPDPVENTTSETEANGTPDQSNNAGQEQQLPDTHPLVRTLAAQKEEIKQLRADRKRVDELETQLAEATTDKDAFTSLQSKYDRLEEFLVKAGGPIGKALDSKSFTKDLFESEKSIEDLVTEWHRSNPSATSTALGSSGSSGSGKVDINALLRAAGK